MNILDTIINTQKGAAVQQLAKAVGLGESQTATALSALVPALASGFQRNLQSPGGLTSLVGALASGKHGEYLDNPAVLGQTNAVTDGNGILGHVLGSKDVSRQVAAQAAAETGISADILKKLLPLAATLMMSAFSRQGASKAGASDPSSGFVDTIGSLLGINLGGSATTGVASILGKFLGR